MVHLACSLYDRCGRVENLCLAGGVGLNCVTNSQLQKHTPFKRIFIQPAAGDGGCALGAALYASHALQCLPQEQRRHSSLYGPEYSDDEIRNFLQSRGAEFTVYDEDGICAETAKLIAENQIIGWFQGRMEFGPRALGNRSILANPRNPEMQDILNRRVKFREDFRPFAPAVSAERAAEYFEVGGESPFMLFTPMVLPGREQEIPAVTHVDHTARVQTVNQTDNPRFHHLIEHIGRLTGVPVVVNTSFNIRGEPIVCSMEDAYNCFLKTDIDYLVMGNCLVEKEF
jgi:carbamoyltransferase